MRARIRSLIASNGFRLALAVIAIITFLLVVSVWFFDRPAQLTLKPSTELLVVLNTLTETRRAPNADETLVLVRHSHEATELLIERMAAAETYSLTHESWSPAMEALAAIGARTVPKLIETIRRAREIATSSRCGDPPLEFCINTQAKTLQTRVVMVLGRIGVRDALPVLLELRSQSDLCPLRCEIDTAINNIESAGRTGKSEATMSIATA